MALNIVDVAFHALAIVVFKGAYFPALLPGHEQHSPEPLAWRLPVELALYIVQGFGVLIRGLQQHLEVLIQ